MTDYRIRQQTERGTAVHHVDNLQPGEGVELVPTDYDTNGNPRRYEVVRVGNPEQQPMVIDDAAPIVSPLPAQMPSATSHVEGSHIDRARAFSIKTWQLSVITGIGLTVGALALSGSALPFLALAGWFFGGFLAVWLAAFALDVLVSSEGSQFLNVVFLWRYLGKEQSERHRRYGAPTPKTWWTTGDKLFFAFIVVWVFLAFVFNELIQSGVLQ